MKSASGDTKYRATCAWRTTIASVGVHACPAAKGEQPIVHSIDREQARLHKDVVVESKVEAVGHVDAVQAALA